MRACVLSSDVILFKSLYKLFNPYKNVRVYHFYIKCNIDTKWLDFRLLGHIYKLKHIRLTSDRWTNDLENLLSFFWALLFIVSELQPNFVKFVFKRTEFESNLYALTNKNYIWDQTLLNTQLEQNTTIIQTFRLEFD